MTLWLAFQLVSKTWVFVGIFHSKSVKVPKQLCCGALLLKSLLTSDLVTLCYITAVLQKTLNSLTFRIILDMWFSVQQHYSPASPSSDYQMKPNTQYLFLIFNLMSYSISPRISSLLFITHCISWIAKSTMTNTFKMSQNGSNLHNSTWKLPQNVLKFKKGLFLPLISPIYTIKSKTSSSLFVLSAPVGKHVIRSFINC